MSEQNVPYKIYLSENEIPRQWYNLNAAMKEKHDPFLNPATGKPARRTTCAPCSATSASSRS